MTEPTQTIEKPKDFMTVQLQGGDPVEVFMSAGLIRKLTAITTAYGDLTQIYTDPFAQEALMVEALKPRSKRGEEVGVYTLDDFPMTTDEANKLVAWIGDHVFHFFTVNAEMLKMILTGEALQKLQVSLTGLQNLVPQTPSAGPTNVEQAA